MKVSIAIPQTGALATAEAVSAVAQLAETEGLHGAWVLDRLLKPLEPRDPYPATADGALSPQFDRTLDPLQVLAHVAATTDRIRIGTAVLVMPWYNPITLARTLATLDVLSGGRVDVGLGTGWSRDEHLAAGAPEHPESAHLDEFVDLLVHAWTDDIVEHGGGHYRVPASTIGLAPIQRPHPPLVFAAYSAAAMRRVARIGSGWMPAGIQIEPMEQMWGTIKQMAASYGRDGDDIGLIVRGNIWSTDHIAGERPLFCGSAAQIADDIGRCQRIGADEVILDAQFTEAASNIERYVDTIGSIVERSRRLLTLRV